SGIVVGRHHWFSSVFYEGYVESKSTVAIEVMSQLEHTRSVFPRAVLDRTRRAFVQRKADASRALENATVDAAGRSLVETHLRAFLETIENDDRLYAPVVVRSRERIYLDAAKTQLACPQDSVAPVGTLVGPAIATQGDMMKAAMLDVEWRWGPPAKCDAIH